MKIGRLKPSSPPRFPNSHSTPLPESPRPRFPGALPPIWNVPQMRNPNFTGREKILTDLHDNLNSDHTSTWIQALTGLGGKGKTSLAREYAYRYKAEYDGVWWVARERASDPGNGLFRSCCKARSASKRFCRSEYNPKCSETLAGTKPEMAANLR